MASDPVELAAETRVKAWHPHGDESFEAYRRRLITAQLNAIREDGWLVVRPAERDDHFVTFDAEGWQIEHSAKCRNAGQMLSGCKVHRELSDWCPGAPIRGEGRYRVVTLDVFPVFHEPPPTAGLAHTFGLRKVRDDEPRPEALLITDEWTPEEDPDAR